jgi:hypothetical protein
MIPMPVRNYKHVRPSGRRLWRKWEIQLLDTTFDADVAGKIDRTVAAV